GLVLSGKGPLWLYGRLVHLAHAFAWVAVYDPQLSGGVVVMRHRSGAPLLGEVVPLESPASAAPAGPLPALSWSPPRPGPFGPMATLALDPPGGASFAPGDLPAL